MNILQITQKKLNKQKLSEQEISYFVENFVKGKISEEDAIEFLKAVYKNGLNIQETTYLTNSMARSGEMIDLSDVGECVDKHSTGGVSDTTTLVIVPVLASLGVKVAKMSGRSLGWTGGTADKIEVFDGYDNNLSEEDFKKVILKYGGSLISQSNKIAVADKKIYALRDKTGLVDNISLIASSIMSKKIACGAKVLLLDVKYGEGAFMKDYRSAKKLAKVMCKIGKISGIKTCAIISNMNEPLSSYIGNNLEVYSAINVLDGKGLSENLAKLCKIIVATLLKKLGKTNSVHDGEELVEKVLKNGEALEKLKIIVKAHNGDTAKIERPSLLLDSKKSVNVISEKDGYISHIKCRELGSLLHEICEKEIDKNDKNMVGIKINFEKNHKVKNHDVLATINYANCDNINYYVEKVKNCFIIQNKKGKEYKLIKKIIF